MKRIIPILAFWFVLASCGEAPKQSEEAPESNSVSQEKPPPPVTPASEIVEQNPISNSSENSLSEDSLIETQEPSEITTSETQVGAEVSEVMTSETVSTPANESATVSSESEEPSSTAQEFCSTFFSTANPKLSHWIEHVQKKYPKKNHSASSKEKKNKTKDKKDKKIKEAKPQKEKKNNPDKKSIHCGSVITDYTTLEENSNCTSASKPALTIVGNEIQVDGNGFSIKSDFPVSVLILGEANTVFDLQAHNPNDQDAILAFEKSATNRCENIRYVSPLHSSFESFSLFFLKIFSYFKSFTTRWL